MLIDRKKEKQKTKTNAKETQLARSIESIESIFIKYLVLIQ